MKGRVLLVSLIFLFAATFTETVSMPQAGGSGGRASGRDISPAPITVDYPEEGSIFPPEITAPTFLWQDGAKTAVRWRIDFSFASGSAAIQAASRGARLRVGEIDPSCVAETNKPPRLTSRLASARSWLPDEATWRLIKQHSARGAVSMTIAGLDAANPGVVVSRGRVNFRISSDPVGAPIFYRDVPLMPTETEKGDIKPLAPYAVRLIRWRLRYVGESGSHVLLENLPVCANCHSFSANGRMLGMDLDGLQNNKGLYTLTPVGPDTSIKKENVIQWSTSEAQLQGKIRVGFMSQVSPEGNYVVTTIDSSQVPGASRPAGSSAGAPDPTSNTSDPVSELAEPYLLDRFRVRPGQRPCLRPTAQFQRVGPSSFLLKDLESRQHGNSCSPAGSLTRRTRTGLCDRREF